LIRPRARGVRPPGRAAAVVGGGLARRTAAARRRVAINKTVVFGVGFRTADVGWTGSDSSASRVPVRCERASHRVDGVPTVYSVVRGRPTGNESAEVNFSVQIYWSREIQRGVMLL